MPALTWLGQSGFLIESAGERSAMSGSDSASR